MLFSQKISKRNYTSLRLRSQMSSAPSSEPATTHLPWGSVVENAANTQYLLFWWPAKHGFAGQSGRLDLVQELGRDRAAVHKHQDLAISWQRQEMR